MGSQPMAVPCARDIGRESPGTLPLRVDGVIRDDTGLATTLHCTDIERTELRVAVHGSSAVESSWKPDQWYRFAGVTRAESSDTELVFPADEGSVNRTEAPEPRSHPPRSECEDPWVTQLGASNEFVVVTVQLRPVDTTTHSSADAPESFEIGAVCFNHLSRDDDTTVYHREAPDTHDEQLLLEHVAEGLAAIEGATLITYGPDRSPLALLRARFAVAATGDIVDTGAEQTLNRCFHADFGAVAARVDAETVPALAREVGVTTDSVRLDEFDLQAAPEEWRADWHIEDLPLESRSDPRMIDQDYTTLLERYLRADDGTTSTTALGRCLKAYASADVPMLSELATNKEFASLACPLAGGAGK